MLQRSRNRSKYLERALRRPALLVGVVALLLVSLACTPAELFFSPTPTPEPTRQTAPTFTPTPDSIQALLVVTPPNAGTPGVIIVPPGVDPSRLIPVPTATWTPTPTLTSTPLATVTPQDDAPLTGSPEAESMQTVTASTSDAPVTTVVTTPAPPDPSAPPVQVSTDTPVAPPILPTPTVDRSRVVVFVPGPTPAAPAIPPTETPTPLPTPTPTATPTPFVLVDAGLVSLRSGPGVEYPLVAQLGPDIPIAVVARNPEGTWLQICCVNAQSVWVAASHVAVINNIVGVGLELPPASPPPPTPTPTPTDTPTITPTPTSTPYPFTVAEGPIYMPTNNEHLSIYVKIYAGSSENPQPLPGYFVRVEFRNRPEGSAWDSRQNTRSDASSNDYFEYSAPAGPAGGNRVPFNYKFEFRPPDPQAENPNATETRLTLIDGYWRMYLTDGSGIQLTDYIQFDTLGGNPNREVFVAWTPR
ncbi:MAG: SH3 domain-containing protein [Litorilinea sp.]